MDGTALSNLRSSVAKGVARLPGPSVAHRRPGAGHGEHPSTDSTSGGVRLSNGAAFLNDERAMRLLAREIKRLIMEDVRRGIDI